jgi:uncharacterized delta-60 repeat protein
MYASMFSLFNSHRLSLFFVKSALVVTLLLSNALAVFAYDGAVDLSYTSNIFNAGEGIVVVQQPDGKILVGGLFSHVNGVRQQSFVRLNADGTVDQTFSAPRFTGVVRNITLQPDGKILVGGTPLNAEINGQLRRGFFRLNPDGSRDETFVDGLGLGLTFNGVGSASLQADGKILVTYGSSFSNSLPSIARLNSDGTRDNSFNAVLGGPVPLSSYVFSSIIALPDGKSLLYGPFSTVNGVTKPALARLNSNGSLDTTFNPAFIPTPVEGNECPFTIALQADGKIIVAGSSLFSINPLGRIRRLNPDGSVDPSFSASPDAPVRKVKVLADGKMLIGGDFTMINSTLRNHVAKLNADGTLDTSFNANPNGQVEDLVASDNPVIVGLINTVNNVQRPGIARLDAAGNVDPNFAAALGVGGTIRKILALPDGKVLVSGDFIRVGNTPTGNLIRLNADGTLDSSFNSAISLPTSDCDLKISADSRIGVGCRVRVNSTGAFKDFVILNYDGSLNTSSTPSVTGTVNKLAFFPNGKVLLVGRFNVQGGPSTLAAIFNTDGTRDTSFMPIFDSDTSLGVGAAIRNDGKFYIAGGFVFVNGMLRATVAGFNADGSLDLTFAPGDPIFSLYYVTVNPTNIYIQPNGKLLVTGKFTGVGTKYLIRLNTDGSLDSSFGSPETVSFNGGFDEDIVIQPDGRILMIELNSSKVIRLKQNGRYDYSFNRNGSGAQSNTLPGFTAEGIISTIAIQSDNRILAAGRFDLYNDVPRFSIARLENSMLTPSTDFDFDADGKSDLAVFRPSDTNWHILKSSNNNYSATTFGLSDDKLVPADYDRDGITDFAIFRPSDGFWYILNSLTNQVSTIRFGQAGDIPVPADYDNDGILDFAVYRPSTGIWWLRLSSLGYLASINFNVRAIPFGAAGDIPTVGDFSGDGRADIAVWRPSTGVWYWLDSFSRTNQLFAYQLGVEGDKPTPADYDGDGKTDLSVYRPSNGTWYRLNSTDNSLTAVRYGLEEDKPVPADYDGDGKADIAVYRPSSGVWYELRSTQGQHAEPFGLSGDLPIQNAFVP